jgi:hypothetical protein
MRSLSMVVYTPYMNAPPRASRSPVSRGVPAPWRLSDTDTSATPAILCGWVVSLGLRRVGLSFLLSYACIYMHSVSVCLGVYLTATTANLATLNGSSRNKVLSSSVKKPVHRHPRTWLLRRAHGRGRAGGKVGVRVAVGGRAGGRT